MTTELKRFEGTWRISEWMRGPRTFRYGAQDGSTQSRDSARPRACASFLLCQEFIARLAALIPRPRAHLVTYHGVFAPAAAWRDRVVQGPPVDHFDSTPHEPCSHGSTMTTPPERPRDRRPNSWAELMKRVYRIDVLVCERCAGVRKLLAAILESHAIRKVLAHLVLATEPPKTR